MWPDPSRHSGIRTAGVVLWGILLALWLTRVELVHAPDRFHVNDESFSYAGRLIEFRDQLRAGYYSPEWCTDFRGGLGSPHYVYYQPGLFYAASLVPWSVPPVRALGLTVVGFAMLGYLVMYGLVAQRFGRLAGWLAASALLLASYTCTEIYVRGDLSEYAAMMVLPATLYGLAGWLERGGRRHLVLLTAAAGATIVLHPAIGLLSHGMAALALAGFAWETRRWDRVGSAAAALGVAAGLAAFYWLPLLLGWDLVNSHLAFESANHYSKNFVWPLTRLVGPYSQQFPKALTLDVLFPILVLLSLVYTVRRWGDMTPSQRRLAIFSLAGTLCFTLLMTKLSKPVWHMVPLLQRMQFPWRAFTVVTVLAAAASGSMLLWQTGKRRVALAGLLVLEMWLLSFQYTAHRLDGRRVPQRVEELARQHFAPDVCGEWLPRGAIADIPESLRAAPSAGPSCRVGRFVRTQGRLSCHVRAATPSFVVLPHYYFPVGWQATLGGQTVALKPDARGLMRVALPAGTDAELVVRFHRTPMRSAGLAISAASLLLGTVALVVAGRRSTPGHPPTEQRGLRPHVRDFLGRGPVGAELKQAGT